MNRNSLFSALPWILMLSVLVFTSCNPDPTPSVATPTPQPDQMQTETSSPVLPTDTPAPPTPPANTPPPEDKATPGIPPEPSQPVVDKQDFTLICARNEQLDPQQPLETTPFFVKGQVILTGPANRIDSVVDELALKGIQLTSVYRCTLGIPVQLPDISGGNDVFSKESKRGGRQAAFPFSSGPDGMPEVSGGQGLAMNLYQFDDRSTTLLNVFDELNVLERDGRPQERIYADANYLTGHLSNSACGNPFGVEGSPFGVEGSPFGVEGSPNGGMSGDADPDGFWKQWAFQRIGLLDEPGSRPFKETGEGVRVGVFDTSPYKPQNSETQLTITEDKITPPLILTVHFPIALPNLIMTAPSTTTYNVQDHGLFVSSLIHALAFRSQIDLYEVLDEKGCGDLFRLNVAVLHFLSSQWGGDQLKQPAVVNLSLGVRKPSDLPADQAARGQAESELENLSQEIRDAYALAVVDRSVESMETVMQLTNRAGMVIVAAAGNNSVPNNPPNRRPPLRNMPLSMDLPADYHFVVGISATNSTDAPACYSNLGDVGAPGGDAEEGVEPITNAPVCVSLAVDCPGLDASSPGACEYGVMGMSTQTQTRFAYWSGTSFATPLASGLAALLYEHTDNPVVVKARLVSEVNQIGDPRYGRGVIQVEKALTLTP